MADPLETVQKLIALAMDNPSAEESRSAALKAIAMIVEHNITLGDKAARTFDDVRMPKKTWAPDDEFDAFYARATAQAQDGVDPDSPDYDFFTNPKGTSLKTTQVNTDLDDDFMRKRIKIAWQALRRERARLKQEIEREFCLRYQKPYPRPEPVDWEKP